MEYSLGEMKEREQRDPWMVMQIQKEMLEITICAFGDSKRKHLMGYTVI